MGRVAAGLLTVGLVVSCSGSDDPRSGEPAAVGDQDNSRIVARHQTTTGGELVLDDLTLPGGGGFVVVHADGGGAPGERLAVSQHLTGSPRTDVEIDLDTPLPGTGTYWVMLYADTDADRVFDDAIDQPAITDGAVVVLPIELELTEQ